MAHPTDFPVKRALISVSDKTGLKALAAELTRIGIEIVSTGGTAAFLRDEGIPVLPVTDVTGFPEILEGRVKTLHPAIHGGILANLSQSSTQDTLSTHGIAPIGLVVINLYPFEEAMIKSTGDAAAMIETIDIGGCALLRAAAKNHAFVTVVCDPADYELVAHELTSEGGATSLATRQRLAGKAFARTAAYDAAIASWFASQSGDEPPARYTLSGVLQQALRYGENPHQSAALYASPAAAYPGIARAEQVQGKELSYNNITDADAAFELISDFGGDISAAVIVKHANPCGAALGGTLLEAYQKALACDPVSAYGGIVAVNQPLDEAAAKAILKKFTEVVIAPSASVEAKRAFAARPNIRLLLTNGLLPANGRAASLRSVSGGFLVQDSDLEDGEETALRVVTSRKPTPREEADMIFAMRVAKHVRSNAIVFARDGATLGVGAGQMSRVDSVRIARWKAEEAASAAKRDPAGALAGSSVASDAFFPFADGLLAAADAGATAVIQPGGSMRDEEVIAAADERGLAMVFTGVRHFRH